MARYLLDTTVLIDFSKNREPIRSKVLSMISNGDELGICAINVTEFYSNLPMAQRKKWSIFFSSLNYWNINVNIAKNAGIYRYEFMRKGYTLSTPDTIIAAVAKEVSATVVTANVKDYPMKDISIMPLQLVG